MNGFDLSRVRLLDGPVLDRQRRNTAYLLQLDPDRLLHTFRLQAGLPSTAAPLGGWEAPDCGLRGHFVGHYLSACAQGFAATGEASLGDRARAIVAGLATCQDAIGSGYVSAFSESDLDAIETRFEGAWASYYVLHKILAGLLDAHRYCVGERALTTAARLGDYIQSRIARLSPEQIAGMCRTDQNPNPTNEFGGLAEALQDLADATGQACFDELARVFEPEWFLTPLLNGEDHLTGLHANTHIPIALALARRYERTGDAKLRGALQYFWERTALARSYVNGGSSGPRPDRSEKSKGGEHWPAPFQLAGTLTPKINESCVTHNMLRLTDALFRWTADPRYAAFYQRAYLNHVLAMQDPRRPGGYLYDHPLGPVSTKTFGQATESFWCCYGSSVEAFARLGQGIYYHDDRRLCVNLPVASELSWPEKGVRVTQQTRFPHESITRLTFHCDGPVNLTVAVLGAEPVTKTWHDGNTLDVPLDMRLHSESMPDDPTMVALLYGPIVLAVRTNQPLVLPSPRQVRRVDDDRLRFCGKSAVGEVQLVPLADIVDESFAVYGRLED